MLGFLKGLPSLDPKFLGLTAVAFFFTLVRTVIRQEYRNAAGLLFSSLLSLVCAVAVGYLLADDAKNTRWFVWAGVALTALLAQDIIKVILNLGSAAAKDESYGARILAMILGRVVPTPREDNHD